jgi:ArsR family transcriptional regulator, lead/cadmium/zinc/bismuth-responsive transcriptional repressor
MSDKSYTHKCLSILGNELRLNIVGSLQDKNMSVRELCNTLGKEQSAVSHALQQLRHCNFVDFKKKGKEREYYLKSKIFEQKNKSLIEMIEEHTEKYCKGKH